MVLVRRAVMRLVALTVTVSCPEHLVLREAETTWKLFVKVAVLVSVAGFLSVTGLLGDERTEEVALDPVSVPLEFDLVLVRV